MIAIGRYHIGAVLPEWLDAWEQLRKPTKSDGTPDWAIYSVKRQLVHTARNHIIASALDQYPDELTHVFFLDDDVIVPPDGLFRMLNTNLPVVTGFCIQRNEPYFPCVYRRNAEGKHIHLTHFVQGLQQVDACGGACLLVRVDVLRAIQKTGEPWFDFPQNGISEDLAFCDRVTKLGFPIVLNFDVQCDHLGILHANLALFQQIQSTITHDNEEIARLTQDVRPWSY